MENNVLMIDVGSAFCLIERHAERFMDYIGVSTAQQCNRLAICPTSLWGRMARVVGCR
jgi:hypothetical protein